MDAKISLNFSTRDCVEFRKGHDWRMKHATNGRPRSFDEDQAVDAAMRVFWEKSFEGTTMTDLTDATGLSRSSIHAAFGSKEGLFLKAVERYKSGPMRYIPKALAEPTLPSSHRGALSRNGELPLDPR